MRSNCKHTRDVHSLRVTQSLLLSLAVLFIAFPFLHQHADAVATVKVGDKVVLVARRRIGVPVHSQPTHTGSYEHTLDRSWGRVIAINAEAPRWIHILGVDTEGKAFKGWINIRYIGDVIPVPADKHNSDWDANWDSEWDFVSDDEKVNTESDMENLVWQSRKDCWKAVKGGARMRRSDDPNRLRIATWNVEWFPTGTDVSWFACTIAWMNVDVVALQEIKATDFAIQKLNDVAETLGQIHGSWSLDLSECGAPGHQHVGFLWNSDKVTLSDFVDAGEFNGRWKSGQSDACVGRLRPGRVTRITFGQSTFHLVSVHLKAMSQRRSMNIRLVVYKRLNMDLVKKLVAPLKSSDAEMLVMGDFNTVGNGDVNPKQEARIMRKMVEKRGFTALSASYLCTSYYHGRGSTLDHVVVTNSMLHRNLVAEVTGYCSMLHCEDMSRHTVIAANEDLSDHCPVVVSFDVAA